MFINREFANVWSQIIRMNNLHYFEIVHNLEVAGNSNKLG